MSEVVVDTNILVRAFLSGKKEEDRILRKANENGRRLIYGRGQLRELVEVLGYQRISKKYVINNDELKSFGEWLMRKKEVVPEKVDICRDPDDNLVIGLAVREAKNGKVFLETGDKDILVLKGKIKNVEIMTPGEFVKECT